MTVQKAPVARQFGPTFLLDRRDQRPGTHFAAELGARQRQAKNPAPAEEHEIDEDLGCCAYGIDLLFLPRD